jgi:hypothetical protein
MSNVLLHIGRADEPSKWNEVENNADGGNMRYTADTSPHYLLSGLHDITHVCPAVAAPCLQRSCYN